MEPPRHREAGGLMGAEHRGEGPGAHSWALSGWLVCGPSGPKHRFSSRSHSSGLSLPLPGSTLPLTCPGAWPQGTGWAVAAKGRSQVGGAGCRHTGPLETTHYCNQNVDVLTP